MRILILADASVYHPYKWAKQLKILGNDVRILTFEKPLKPYDTLWIRKFGGKFKYFLGFNEVITAIKEFKPHIIFPHFLPNYGIISSFFKGFKILALWGSDILAWPFKTPLHKAIAKNVLSKYDMIVCDAKFIKGILKDKFGLDGELIKVVPFGVNRELRDKRLLSLPRYEIRIVSIRRLESLFNHKEILKFVRMLSSHFKIHLIYLNDGSMREEIKRKARKLNVELDFLGKLPFKDYINILRNSHFCISIPHRDATSVSLLESMALGCVPIVSDIPANREWVDDSTAIISSPRAEILYHKFMKTFSWNWWENARIKNKEKINSRCDWENNVKLFWEQVLERFSA